MILSDEKTFYSGSIQNFKMKGYGIRMIIQEDENQNETFLFTKGIWENNKCTEPLPSCTQEERDKVKSK